MYRTTPHLRSIAHRLIASETRKGRSAGTSATVLFPATNRLRPRLATLVGRGGVRALLARALSLAAVEVPLLRDAQLNPEGDLEWPEGLTPDPKSFEFTESRVVLLAQLLGLLVALIGPGLTSRLVGEIWPKVPLKHRDFGKEQEL